MQREYAPEQIRAICEAFRAALRAQYQHDDEEFRLEVARAELEAARMRIDFWDEMLTEVKLMNAGIAEDLKAAGGKHTGSGRCSSAIASALACG
jgi:hypothetical protein